MLTFFAWAFGLLTALTLLGWPLMACVGARLHAWQRLAVAPIVAVAALMAAARLLSSMGMPMRDAAWPAVGLVAMLAACAVWRCGLPRLIRRHEAGVLSIAASLSMLMAAIPAFAFGMDWMGTANPDMGHYCLSATRLLSSGLTTPPTVEVLAQGLDNTQWLWWLHGIFGHRCGTDLLLATVSRTTGLPPDAIFMPLIVAMQGAFAMATIAGLGGRVRGTIALLAALALGCSPGQALGVSAQLIGQVVGLGLIMVAVTTLTADWRPRYLAGTAWIRRGMGLALPATGLFLAYPEISPLLGVGACTWFILEVLAGPRPLDVRAMRPLLAASLIFAIAANAAIPATIHFILSQSGTLNRDLAGGVALFPQFLDLGGMPSLFGLTTSDGALPSHWRGDFLILIALGISAVLLRAWYGWWRAERAVAPVLGLCLAAVFLLLSVRGDGFGAYKAAWFLQPLLWLGIAWSARLPQRKLWQRAACIPLVALIAYNAKHTIDQGRDFISNDLRYVPGFSSQGLNREARTLLATAPRGSLVAIEAFQLSTAKLQAAQAVGLRTGHLAINALHERGVERDQVERGLALENEMVERLRQGAMSNPAIATYRDTALSRFSWQTVTFPGPVPWTTRIFEDAVVDDAALKDAHLLEVPGAWSVFNRCRANGGPAGDLPALTSIAELASHLVPIEAKGAAITVQVDGVGLYPLEADTMRPGCPFASMGRRIACRVIGADQPSLPIVSFTTGHLRGEASRLPAIRLAGTASMILPIVGRGSCRVLGGPVEPLRHPAGRFIALDTDREAKLLSSPSDGPFLAHALRPHIGYEWRSITGWLREWSLVAIESESAITKVRAGDYALPDLLRSHTCFYSGIWEDGWMGEESYLIVGNQAEVTLAGLALPGVADPDGSATITIELAGVTKQYRVAPGRFVLSLGSAPAPGAVLRIRPARTQQLPDPDGRIVGLLLERITCRSGINP